MSNNIVKVHNFLVPNSMNNFNHALQYSEKECIIFDPFSGEYLMEELKQKNLEVKAIFVTHEHFDHICGVDYFKKFKDIKLYGPKNIVEKFDEFNTEIIKNNHGVFFGPIELICYETLGHTMNHFSYYFSYKDISALFCGDTIFSGGVGNCKNGGDPDTLFNTISWVKEKFSDKTILYVGHDYLLNNLDFLSSIGENFMKEELVEFWKKKKEKGEHFFTTIGLEKKYNLFFQATKNEFIKLRQKRDQW